MNRQELTETAKRFIEHAPHALPGPDDLEGFWFYADEGDVFLCQNCFGRISARGCKMPVAGAPSWVGEPKGKCICCE